jgi:hypothetical protein
MTAKFLLALVSAVIPGSDDILLSEGSDSHQIPYLKECKSQSYVTTDGQSASLSWCKSRILGPRPDFCNFQTVAGLLMWCALSDEMTNLSFTTAAANRERSHSQVRVLQDS